MRISKVLGAALFTLTLSGCGGNIINTPSKVQLAPFVKTKWVNASMAGASAADLHYTFKRDEAACKIEALNIPIPSPSCVQPPRQDCTGLTGFALGYCQSNTPAPRCDYSSVNAAKNAQKEVQQNCMYLAGWSIQSSPGPGSDSRGGLFTLAATGEGKEWYIMESTIENDEVSSSVLVRYLNYNNRSDDYQGFMYFDIAAKKFAFDNDQYKAIPPSSAADHILTRIR